MKESIYNNFQEMTCTNRETGEKVSIEYVYSEGNETFVLYYSQDDKGKIKKVDTLNEFKKQYNIVDSSKTGWL